jgi:hypothetical protein
VLRKLLPSGNYQASPAADGRRAPLGVRQRAADDHMFTVTCGGHRVGAFRLQLFIVAGTRPVAVATQIGGEGKSLMNRAES